MTHWEWVARARGVFCVEAALRSGAWGPEDPLPDSWGWTIGEEFGGKAERWKVWFEPRIVLFGFRSGWRRERDRQVVHDFLLQIWFQQRVYLDRREGNPYGSVFDYRWCHRNMFNLGMRPRIGRALWFCPVWVLEELGERVIDRAFWCVVWWLLARGRPIEWLPGNCKRLFELEGREVERVWDEIQDLGWLTEWEDEPGFYSWKTGRPPWAQWLERA